MNQNLEKLNQLLQQIKDEISKVIIGQESVVDLILITLLTRSHALIEGVPGVAKTLLVKTLGAIFDCPAQRIQFTPDLMPADITGTNVFNLKTQEFSLIKGPVFTTLLLADEINRAPAKTQSALLQAMQERCVSIDREHYELDAGFTVFATQNPIEYEGTYPLPEAQKDRFLLKIAMDYPTGEEELELARRMLGQEAPELILEKKAVDTIVSMIQWDELRKSLEGVHVKDEIIKYIVSIVRKTRRFESILVGAGPRATQALILATRAHALLQNRYFVTPDDVKELALPILGHRLVIRPEFEIEGLSIEELIQQLLQEVTVPR